MDFLIYEQNKKDYIEMFTHSGGDFQHYHCDICEQPYPIKSQALKCCGTKKASIISWMRAKKIKPKELYRNIDKLDRMFQKKEFGRTKMVGTEFYPFSNKIERGIKEFEEHIGCVCDSSHCLWNIIKIGSMSPKECYKIYEQEMHKLADEITIKARKIEEKGGQE